MSCEIPTLPYGKPTQYKSCKARFFLFERKTVATIFVGQKDILQS
jgi:hypothetical protein